MIANINRVQVDFGVFFLSFRNAVFSREEESLLAKMLKNFKSLCHYTFLV